ALHPELAQGSSVPPGTLASLALSVDGVAAAEERLILPIQVDASRDGEAILVPGVLIGVPVESGGPQIDGLFAHAGRRLGPEDAGQPVAMLEAHFARHFGLPAQGQVRISGGAALDYVGHALTPEYFVVTTETGGLLAEANFAAVFTSIQTARLLGNREEQVNDLVVTLEAGASRPEARERLLGALSAGLGGTGVTVTTREDHPSFAMIEADIDGDQQIYDIFALLIFAGAVVAAFNLISRIVESQRREIGVAMVLGIPPFRIALRPMLVAAQIALLGVIFGIGVGVLLGRAMSGVLQDFSPLPNWQTGFQWRVFLTVGLLGFLLPFVATIWPVWRAVRVTPVEAIRAGYRAARGGGLAPLIRWLHPPGNTFWQIPVRNVVRAPRRSLLTSLGIAAAIAALVAFVGLIDSFLATIDRGDDETLWVNPDRVEVNLDRVYPTTGAEVASILAAPAIRKGLPQLRLGSVAIHDGEEINLQVRLLPLDNDVWAPRLSAGRVDRNTPGIYLSELAARNLGLEPGDRLTVRHPRLEPGGSFALIETEMVVLGLHAHPFRFFAYMDATQAGVFGLDGMSNVVEVLPAAGASRDAVKRELFSLPGVASATGVSESSEAIANLLNEFVVLLRVIEGAMLVLALLIAFNSASINMDERSREHATMFAYGVRVRTVLRMAIAENVILGIVATVLGVLAGAFRRRGGTALFLPTTLPEAEPAAAPTTAPRAVPVVRSFLARLEPAAAPTRAPIRAPPSCLPPGALQPSTPPKFCAWAGAAAPRVRAPTMAAAAAAEASLVTFFFGIACLHRTL
ncbi:MAG TPA: ABC transporter permease, partial [Tepidiformaceae bacterium]|nr:ABC transporter permease [Tepidiformaceae bacterium]